MRLLGYDIIISKAAVSPITSAQGGWRLFTSEPFSGAWQRNVIGRDPKNVLTHSAVYACVTLIASDVGKLGIELVRRDNDGIWTPEENSAYSPVLRKPNRYQTRIKFVENYMVSKLIHGNTYVWKERDQRGVVSAMYVLDPCRVRVMVAPDGSIFYNIGGDNLAGLQSVQLPASEIIHDTMVPLYHPLCGVSPITACALPAVHGLQIQEHSAKFFANSANPGAIITAPQNIPQEDAERIKREWESRAAGDNVGRIIVAGNGLEFKTFGVNSVDAQLIQQLKWTAEQVCTAFHVPPFMVGVGALPSYNNVEALTQMYYSQALQALIESFELCVGEGLGLANDLAIRFNLDDLLQMDTATRVKAAIDGVSGGLFKPDEARKGFNLPKVAGGNQVYLQQQNFSLEALAKRDAKADPFASTTPAPANDPGDDSGDDPGDEQDEGDPPDELSALVEIEKGYHEARLVAV